LVELFRHVRQQKINFFFTTIDVVAAELRKQGKVLRK